ncbi:hypothetical protein LCGC14_2662220, partial [marine sediment metagenome]
TGLSVLEVILGISREGFRKFFFSGRLADSKEKKGNKRLLLSRSVVPGLVRKSSTF